MAKILILTGAHLCTAPRPQKEADSLSAAGHEVIVRGIWFDPVLVDRDRHLMHQNLMHQNIMRQKPWKFLPVLDFRPDRPLDHWRTRLKARLARQRFQQSGKVSPALLGYGARAMLKAALQEKADLTIVHSEAGLWVGEQLLQRGFRVGIDFEDWFSQDLLPTALTTRPVAEIKRLESLLIRHCSYRLTTSQALAKALATVYQSPIPTVIYNTFPTPPRSPAPLPPRSPAPYRLHWFSQTIGPGRGLETLFQALPLLQHPVEIHLRGNCSDATRHWLETQIPDHWRDRLFLHPTVPNDELPARIAEHDIGLALEQPNPPSRNLTITNKLFQYLQAGLAIIATDTAGQREVFQQCPHVGRLIPPQSPADLATAITDLIQSPPSLTAAKQAAQTAAKQFSWESQHDRLIQTVTKALQS